MRIRIQRGWQIAPVDESFDSWLDQHGAALVLFARQWLETQHDAEDAVQEAFLRFWPSRHKAQSPAAYLYSCVKNCAIEMHRSGKRRHQHTAAVSGANVELRLFEATPDGNEFAGAVESAMQRLPLEQREVLVMKIWGGLTFQQIAETLKISANTAASRYRYAIGALRSTVKREAIS